MASGLNRVAERVAEAALRVGRDPDEVTVVAVSKGRSIEQIKELYDAGHRHFGENRADEFTEKAGALPDDIVWHFVGSIQSRKVKQIAPVASWVHSLDRRKLVRTFAEQPGTPRHLIQVNIAGEEQKHGIAPENAGELLLVAGAAGLAVGGLMVIPPVPESPGDSRRWFVALRDLRDRLATPDVPLEVLSMGMTDDFEVAVEEGATFVRIGRAIFDR